MDRESIFEELENLLDQLGNKQLPEELKVTITYVTGEKDVFNVSIAFWARILVATKNRNQYLYYKDNLINLNHVVKMQYEKL